MWHLGGPACPGVCPGVRHTGCSVPCTPTPGGITPCCCSKERLGALSLQGKQGAGTHRLAPSHAAWLGAAGPWRSATALPGSSSVPDTGPSCTWEHWDIGTVAHGALPQAATAPWQSLATPKCHRPPQGGCQGVTLSQPADEFGPFALQLSRQSLELPPLSHAQLGFWCDARPWGEQSPLIL